MFPHTVTVFNSYEDDDLKMHNSITVLRGVLLDMSKGQYDRRQENVCRAKSVLCGGGSTGIVDAG